MAQRSQTKAASPTNAEALGRRDSYGPIGPIGGRKKSDFLERFEGRNSFMNKEGHLGIVNSTNKPIIKIG